jgi:sugar phosphate isomerase/epimerase
MDFSVASYSFHRALAAGKQDMFKYITDSKALGCTHLDPWNGHLELLIRESKDFMGGRNALRPHFSPAGVEYAKKVRAAVDEAGLPVACLAVDGAHIWEESGPARDFNRMAARRWMDIAEILGAQNIRIDTGGTPDMPEEQFDIIVRGYRDHLKYAGERGLGIILENHWGATKIPANVIKVIEAVPELKLLFDSTNWEPSLMEEGWTTCAKYAKSVHIKTRAWDENGNDPTNDVPRVVRLLVEAGYNGVWGVESVAEGDEYDNARKSLDLVKRSLSQAQGGGNFTLSSNPLTF